MADNGLRADDLRICEKCAYFGEYGTTGDASSLPFTFTKLTPIGVRRQVQAEKKKQAEADAEYGAMVAANLGYPGIERFGSSESGEYSIGWCDACNTRGILVTDGYVLYRPGAEQGGE